jgi:hypothetical protein
MTEEEKRLIIAKGISALFDVIDTIGFDEEKIDAYTGVAVSTTDILALRDMLVDPENDSHFSVWTSLENIASVLWS